MHIAIINSFPAAPYTAETEYIRRFVEAARRTGNTAYEVVTSDDILDCRPDFVLANHEFSPKLTPYFTIGTMWGPYSYIMKDARKLRAVLSYDAYLIGSTKVATYLDALEASTGVRKPRSDFTFLPTALASQFEDRPGSNVRTLAYIGVHWDGQRHNKLLKKLSDNHLINIYGPPRSWKDYPASYRGTVPFDGGAVTTTLRKHGIALCIHKDEHRIADTPSMRMFEAASAGCLIIVDEIPFARRVLGDTVFHIDLKESAEKNLKKISEIINWVEQNPGLANEMARRSHGILNQEYSIENLIEKTCGFYKDCLQNLQSRDGDTTRYYASRTPAPVNDEPLIDVIVRAGSRDVSKLRRALRSIASQTVGTYRVLLIDYKGREDIAECAASETTQRMRIDYIRVEDTGLRSTSLWKGLNSVKAKFFSMLDDDDTILPSHFANLLSLAKEDPEHVLYYSGSILFEEEPGHYMSPVNFSGPLGAELNERRELKFLDAFNFARICEFDNFILTNSWIARSEALDEVVLKDPCFEVAEDMYFYFMLARKGSFKLFPSPTAVWHFRSSSKDNSMLGVNQIVWENDIGKMKIRASQERMHNGLTLGEMRQMLDLPSLKVTEPVVPVRPEAMPSSVLSSILPSNLAGARVWGFHPPEPDGIWTSARNAGLTLKLDDLYSEIELELRLTALSSGDTTQRVGIDVNGRRFFSSNVPNWQEVVVKGPVTFLRATSSLEIRITSSDMVSPSSYGSPDPRVLGVYISKIKYEATSSASPLLKEVIG